MVAMTSTALPANQLRRRHSTTDPPAPVARRLVLVPASGRSDELVRRYRLARLRVEGRETTPPAPERFAYLRQRHD